MDGARFRAWHVPVNSFAGICLLSAFAKIMTFAHLGLRLLLGSRSHREQSRDIELHLLGPHQKGMGEVSHARDKTRTPRRRLRQDVGVGVEPSTVLLPALRGAEGGISGSIWSEACGRFFFPFISNSLQCREVFLVAP